MNFGSKWESLRQAPRHARQSQASHETRSEGLESLFLFTPISSLTGAPRAGSILQLVCGELEPVSAPMATATTRTRRLPLITRRRISRTPARLILLIGFDTDRFDWRVRRSTTPAVAMKVYEDHPPDFEIRKGPIACGAAGPYPSSAQATRAGQDICS